MIVYTLGTIFFPFDRAVLWLKVLLEQEIIVEPVLLQHGATSVTRISHPLLTTTVSLSRPEMRNVIQQSSLVISHAGQGSTRMLAEMGACFILLPRLKRYGEHVDDHQLLFAQAVEPYGIPYSTGLEDLIRYVKYRPPVFKGDLFKAPSLAEYLTSRYQGVEANR